VIHASNDHKNFLLFYFSGQAFPEWLASFSGTPPALLSAIMGYGIMRKVNVFADTPTEHFPSKILYINIYIL
jgi:hypothetical protein